MSLIEALLQGILQGLTEFLPVSSSGPISIFYRAVRGNGDSVFHFASLRHVNCCFFGVL